MSTDDKYTALRSSLTAIEHPTLRESCSILIDMAVAISAGMTTVDAARSTRAWSTWRSLHNSDEVSEAEKDIASVVISAVVTAEPDTAYELERARALLDGAREQCERHLADLLVERAANQRLAVEAAYGRALLRLVEQIRRFRRAADGGRLDFDMSIYAVASAAKDEINEVLLERRGSAAAADECIDALAVVLQLFVGQGFGDADLLARLGIGGERLATRLDAVDAGLTWAEAKTCQRSASGDIQRLFAAVLAPDPDTEIAVQAARDLITLLRMEPTP